MLSGPKVVRRSWMLFFLCIKMLIAFVFQEDSQAELAEGDQALFVFSCIYKCCLPLFSRKPAMLSGPKVVRRSWMLFFLCIKMLIASSFQDDSQAELAKGDQALFVLFQ